MAEWKKIITSGSTGEVAGLSSSLALVPTTDNGADLGSTGLEWKDLYIDGVAYLDGAQIGTLGAALDANNQNITNIDIDSGNISGTDIDVSGQTLTLDNDQISGDKIDGGTIGSTTITTLTGTTITGTTIKNFTAISSSEAGTGSFGRVEVDSTGSFGHIITTGGMISGSFQGDGSGLTGVGTDIDTLSDYGAQTMHQTQDHFLISDNGTEKKVTFSDLEDSIFANVSGDATIAGGGALTIGANAVEGSMLNSNTAGDGLSYGSNELSVDLSGLSSVSIGASTSEVTIGDNLTIAGNLTVNGETTTVSTTNTEVKDQFLFLNSGSNSGDGGIIVQNTAHNSGSAFVFDDSADRWAFSSGSGKTDTAIVPHAYTSEVVTNDNLAYKRKNGNIRVEGDEIYIYVE